MKQKTFAARAIAAALALAMVAQGSIVRAELIGAEAVATPSQAERDRAKVQAFIERASVKERLQALGVSGLVAGDHVGALTEQEVHALAQRIDAMPAGGALSNNDLLLIVLIAILVAIII